MEVRFLHPRYSDVYVAEVSPLLTVKQAIQALHSVDTGPFLPPLQNGEDDKLVLRKTNTVLAPDITMQAAGVAEGDILEVVRGGQGAERR